MQLLLLSLLEQDLKANNFLQNNCLLTFFHKKYRIKYNKYMKKSTLLLQKKKYLK